MRINRRRIYAGEEIDTQPAGQVSVDDAATEMLFETEDVAELVAEVTGESVEVSVENDEVTFSVGDDEYTVTPDGDEEVLEAVRKPLRNKRSIKASTYRRPVGRRIRKLPSSRR